MRALRPGFGFMGFSTGEIIRMAAGNITLEDIEQVSYMVPPAPRVGNQFPGWSPEMGGPSAETGAPIVESDPLESRAGGSQESVNAPVEAVGATPTERPARPFPMMSEVQAVQFRALYPKVGSIDGTLDSIEGCNHRHREHARQLIAHYKLVKDKRA